MKTENKRFTKNAIVTSTLVTAAIAGLSVLNANDANLLSYDNLGSGAELRSDLLSVNSSNAANSATTVKFSELKCGEGKCGEGKCGEAKDSTSTKEGKEGEAKCGGKKAE